MEFIVAILLWIGALSPGGVYTQSEFDQVVIDNQPAINAVICDPAIHDDVWTYAGTNPDVIVGEGE
ncbi:MAG: hypothetical protein EHM43_01465 [Ignavibacteriae bacterium]|nr:MAG: hypothetical protein EHM43_01465 [Ignavibacteriota bacterium]